MRRLGALVLGIVLPVVVACGDSASPAPSAPVAAGSPLPPVPSESHYWLPPASPAPSIDGTALSEAVVAILQTDPFVAHVEEVADLEVVEASAGSPPKGTKVQTRGTYDVNGDDLRALRSTSVGGEPATERETVALGDTVWTREGDGEFVRQPRTAALQRQALDPMVEGMRLTDDPGLLRFAGRVTRGSTYLLQLKVAPGAILYDAGRFVALDLYVLDDGTPSIVVGTYAGRGGAGELVTGTITLQYSDVTGPPATIEAPVTSP